MSEEQKREMRSLEERVKELIKKSYDRGYNEGYLKGKEDGLNENPKTLGFITAIAVLVFFVLMLSMRGVVI